jgi:hypothetical protein
LNGAIPESWIRQNIDGKYLQEQNRKQIQEISADTQIRLELGDNVAEQHKQELVQKLLCAPKELLEMTLKSVSEEEERAETQDFKPAWEEMFVAEPRFTVECICNPLGRFVDLDISVLTSLDSQQREKVLAVLLESRKKIDEMVEAIQKQ